MNLNFTEKMNEKANCFIEKIWNSLLLGMNPYLDYLYAYEQMYGRRWDKALHSKKTGVKHHSIREGDRWAVGMLIHCVINPYNKKRFQFAPVLTVKSIQTIQIVSVGYLKETLFLVKIDGRDLDSTEVEQLALNDGFDTLEEFIDYFKGDFEGQIIHWTDLKY